jgi:hypothetical protein
MAKRVPHNTFFAPKRSTLFPANEFRVDLAANSRTWYTYWPYPAASGHCNLFNIRFRRS